jgi:hypothetical protein
MLQIPEARAPAALPTLIPLSDKPKNAFENGGNARAPDVLGVSQISLIFQQ